MRHNLQTNTLLTAINKELSKFYTDNQVWTLNYKIGFVIFLVYFNIYQRKKDHRNIFPLIEDCLTHLNDHGSSDTSLFNGLAGLGWMLQHLNNIGVLNRGDIESIHEIDEFILNDLRHETVGNQEFDLLYGLVGKGTYFLSRERNSTVNKALANIFDRLTQTAIITDEFIFWEKGNCVDLGLAHGMPGLLVLFSKFCKVGINGKLSKEYLRKLVSFVMKNKLENNLISYFPTNSNSKEVSRIGWCYGDLSVSIGLCHANSVLCSPIVDKEIRKVVRRCIDRSIDVSGVFRSEKYLDSGLCHGSLGIAYALHKIKQNNGIVGIGSRIDYWRKMSRQRIDVTQPFLNLKTAFPTKYAVDWGLDGGLIDGLAGIGLITMGFSSSELTGWDSIFFLDID